MIDPAPTTGTPATQHRENPGSTGRNTPNSREQPLRLHAGETRPVASGPQPNLSRGETQKPQPAAIDLTADEIQALVHVLLAVEQGCGQLEPEEASAFDKLVEGLPDTEEAA